MKVRRREWIAGTVATGTAVAAGAWKIKDSSKSPQPKVSRNEPGINELVDEFISSEKSECLKLVANWMSDGVAPERALGAVALAPVLTGGDEDIHPMAATFAARRLFSEANNHVEARLPIFWCADNAHQWSKLSRTERRPSEIDQPAAVLRGALAKQQTKAASEATVTLSRTAGLETTSASLGLACTRARNDPHVPIWAAGV